MVNQSNYLLNKQCLPECWVNLTSQLKRQAAICLLTTQILLEEKKLQDNKSRTLVERIRTIWAGYSNNQYLKKI